MLEPKEVVVNGRRYIVNPFNPIDCYNFDWEFKLAQRFGGSSDLGLRVFKQCMDDMARNLGDPENFQKWFSEHPEDMFPLEEKAIEALISPFPKKERNTK